MTHTMEYHTTLATLDIDDATDLHLILCAKSEEELNRSKDEYSPIIPIFPSVLDLLRRVTNQNLNRMMIEFLKLIGQHDCVTHTIGTSQKVSVFLTNQLQFQLKLVKY